MMGRLLKAQLIFLSLCFLNVSIGFAADDEKDCAARSKKTAEMNAAFDAGNTRAAFGMSNEIAQMEENCAAVEARDPLYRSILAFVLQDSNAIAISESAVEFAREQKDSTRLIRAVYMRACIRGRRELYKEALEDFEHVLPWFRRHDQYLLAGKSFYNIASCRRSLGAYP
ncbi:MAG: hypothetical protein AAF570_11450, partial [Bacteroidota bacterium]